MAGLVHADGASRVGRPSTCGEAHGMGRPVSRFLQVRTERACAVPLDLQCLYVPMRVEWKPRHPVWFRCCTACVLGIDRLSGVADEPGVRRDAAGVVKQLAPALLHTLLMSGESRMPCTFRDFR